MAVGDFVLFDQYLVDLHNGVHNWSADTFRWGMITSATTPTAADAAPHWNGTGTTDYSTAEVTPGGNYAAGGPTLAGVSITVTSNILRNDFNDVSILQNASNPTNGRWLVLYNETDANNRACGFLDLGSDRDLSGGDFTYSVPANGGYRVGVGTIT